MLMLMLVLVLALVLVLVFVNVSVSVDVIVFFTGVEHFGAAGQVCTVKSCAGTAHSLFLICQVLVFV